MTEILFYHLEQRPLEAVLPILLEKTLERGWRATIELGTDEAVNELDTKLWTYSEESFLPHGRGDAEQAQDLPVALVSDNSNPNEAQLRFFAKGAVPSADGDYQRLVFLFDGHDPEMVTAARKSWKELSGKHELTYWQQEPNGKWVKKA